MKRIAVFGVGHLGTIHCKCIQQIEGLELVGIYDPDQEKSRKIAEEFGVTAYENPEMLIAAVDLVDIVTTTSMHFAMGKMAIERGKHTFIEKPVCSTLQEAEELMRLAKSKNVLIQVGHVERFNPAFIASQPYIQRPMFIESHRLALFNPRGNDVSVVLDLMIHDLDIILKIMNSDVVSINASGVPVVTDTYDIANIRLGFANGAVANMTASRISLKNMRKIRLFQQGHYISIDLLEKKSDIIYLEDYDDRQEDPFALVMDLGEEKGKKQIKVLKPEIQPVNAIQTELEYFLNAVTKNELPVVTIEDGYKALRLAYDIVAKMNLPVK
ncbi:Gfo/Idh/MocA family oxidoreductase [Bacteroidales bacterium OttesenSCG-928-B11]|nr:Gfo/Idh/MocA family oxidoreductase [Bacteroidales bacterium OttesenSCG-928-B11]